MENNPDFKQVFDYGHINEDHTNAIQEAINLAKSQGLKDFANFLERKFKIVPIKQYDISQSKFCKAANKAGIRCAIQGTLVSGQDEQAIEYPVISICEEVRDLEKIYETIKNEE